MGQKLPFLWNPEKYFHKILLSDFSIYIGWDIRKGTWQKLSKEIEAVAKTYFICLKCKLNRPNKIKKSRFTIFKMLPSLNCTLIYKNEKCIKHGFTGPKCVFL